MILIERTSLGDVEVLTVGGRLDAVSAAHFQQELDEVQQQAAQPLIVLDLGELVYISAAGLRVLRNLERQQGIVRIANPSDRVREVMQITGLHVIYRMFDCLPDAVEHARRNNDSQTARQI